MTPPKTVQSAGATVPAGDLVPHPSAGYEVFHIPELRQRILRLLSPHDLTRVMRVAKGAMADTAKELYFNVTYAHVRNRMGASTMRQRTYCNAVTEINARNISISPAMMKGIPYSSAHPPKPGHILGYLQMYHVEVMELLIPLLQRKCPNVRRIFFGGDVPTIQTNTWTVHLSPESPGTGHISVLEVLCSHRARAPPIAAPALPPAIPGFTIERHFNLFLLNASDAISWRQAFKDKAYFADIGERVGFQDLEVTLDDMSNLYRRQAESQSTHRISHLQAGSVLPYSMADLTTFANLAATSLTVLQLAPISFQPILSCNLHHSLSFSDLPDLVSIFRRLPKLVDLTFSLRGIETAETVCGDMLSQDTLEPGGSVKRLFIVTDHHDDQLFNSLRCLSQLCDTSSDFAVSVADRSAFPDLKQTAFLKYLRSQSPSRRPHLATIDFSTLGFTQLSDVSERSLNFLPDGRIQHEARDGASHWAERAAIALEAVPACIPRLEAGVRECVTSSAKLDEAITAGLPAQRLKAAEDYLKDIIKVKEVTGLIQASAVGPRTEEDVREYIASLKQTMSAL